MNPMTALVTIRSDQDWVGGAIVFACLIAMLGIAKAFEQHLGFDFLVDDPERLVPEDLPVLDHARCVHRDTNGARCSAVLCFCPTLHPKTGQPVTCDGAERPWCHHSLVSRATTGGHCFRHQRLCPDCRVEDFSQWGGVR